MSDIVITVTKEQDGCTAEHILRCMPGVSGTLIKQLKRENAVTIDGTQCRLQDRLHTGQFLKAVVSPVIHHGNRPSFPIIYEDDELIAINKPSGMLVHATKVTYDEITVASEMREYLLIDEFHPINRLDRGTSGIMLIAKSGYAHNLYKPLLHTEKFIRKYLAVCCGTPCPPEGDINAPIGRDPVSPIKRIISADGKPSLTHYKVLSVYGEYSLAEIIPQTGRTHQIRLHMAHIGCPLAGDFLYGQECDDIGRYALHSHYVKFCDPRNGRQIELVCDIPEDMQNLLKTP